MPPLRASANAVFEGYPGRADPTAPLGTRLAPAPPRCPYLRSHSIRACCHCVWLAGVLDRAFTPSGRVRAGLPPLGVKEIHSRIEPPDLFERYVPGFPVAARAAAVAGLSVLHGTWGRVVTVRLLSGSVVQGLHTCSALCVRVGVGACLYAYR